MSRQPGDTRAGNAAVPTDKVNRRADGSRVPDGGRPRPPGPESPRREGQPPQPPRGGFPQLPRYWWVILLGLLAVNWVVGQMVQSATAPQRITVPYSIFKQQLENGNVAQVTSNGNTITGTFKAPVSYTPTGQPQETSTLFTTVQPSWPDPNLEALLEQQKVTVDATQASSSGLGLILTILLSFGPGILLFYLLTRMLSRSGQSGMFSLGRSRARRYEATTEASPITFADVAGIEEAEAELVEVVDFLKNPEKYSRLGGTIPKGVLLVGAPGTGKTLLARAVAGEAGVPFFSLSGSEFVEMIVGVGAARVRDLFANAKKEAPAIIFVDELDAIGRRRGVGNFTGGNEEREQTLNQLLVEMDGFDARQAVIVLAATNRADVLDPALLRPGRFDRRVVVPRPDRRGRLEILKVHTRGVPLAPDVRLEDIAATTPGLVGAELRNLVNEAALLAARRNKQAVDMHDFLDSLEKIVLGTERQIAMTPDDRRRVAFHEAGHALVGLLVPEADPVAKVTVIPRGQALGVTYSLPEDDRYNYPESYLYARIAVALGGRAAEEVVIGEPTTGAENDLKQVTDLARQMVIRWGMSEKVGLIALASDPEQSFLGPTGGTREYSEQTAAVIDGEVKRIIDGSYAEVVKMLTDERPRLEALANALIEHESLDEREILEVTGLPPKHGRERIAELPGAAPSGT